MYNLKEDLGKIKSIKLANGVEIIATLLAVDSKTGIVNLGEPRVIVINDDELALIPYIFTGASEEVIIALSQIQSMVDTLPQSASDYTGIIEGNKKQD